MGSRDSGSGSLLTRLIPGPIRERFVLKFFLSVVVVMVLTAGLGAYFFGTTTATLTDRTETKMESSAQLQADELSRWVDGLRHQTELLSEAPAFQSDNHSDIDFYLLNKDRTLREDVLDVHYVDSNTRTVEVSTSEDLEGRNLSAAGAPWARSQAETVAMETNVPTNVFVGSRPYESPASGERVLAFVSAPPSNTEHVVVVEANISACGRSFDQPVEGGYTTVHGADGGSICGAGGDAGTVPSGVAANGTGFTTAGDEALGYATVTGADWTVLTHAPESAAFGLRDRIGTSVIALVAVPLIALGLVGIVVGSRAGRELDDLTTKAERMREGDLDVDLASDRADEFGDLYRGFDEMRDALKQQIEEAETARREAEVSRAEAIEMSERLQEKADEYSEVMAACARGDLTQRMDADGESEAMDRIAADFNEMVRELELTTGQLQTFADEVTEDGETLHTSVEAVRDASEQIAESVQRISDDAYDQRERLTALAEEIDALGERLRSLAAEHPDLDLDESVSHVERAAGAVEAAADAGETFTTESETVAGAAEEQAAELAAVSGRALELKRTAQYLGDGIGHFETEDEHEFVFQTGSEESIDR